MAKEKQPATQEKQKKLVGLCFSQEAYHDANAEEIQATNKRKREGCRPRGRRRPGNRRC